MSQLHCNSTYRSQPFEKRIKNKDNLSNKAFMAFCKKEKITSDKFGVDGSELHKAYQMNHIIRHAPDKLCRSASGNIFLTEMKGCKKEGLRIKTDCLADYLEWAKLIPVNVFAFESDSHKYAYLSIYELATIAVNVGKSEDQYMGEIYHIPCSMLDWNDVPIIHEPQYADNYNK